MNLMRQLIARIVLIALLSLSGTTVYVLHQVHAETRQQTAIITNSLAKQLELQLLRIDAGFGKPHAFPDFDLWKAYLSSPGVCVSFTSGIGGPKHSVCQGDNIVKAPPAWFTFAYQRLLKPSIVVQQAVVFKNKSYGLLSVTPSAAQEIEHAYAIICQLLSLTIVTVLAVSVLVFLSIQRLLQPAQAIVSGLLKMQQGDLTQRLPEFTVPEWQHTANAINQLVQNQQSLLQKHEQLALKLLTVQEQERNLLAHELHDEFGQCLVAINALSASLVQALAPPQPSLADEARRIGDISQHIMENLRHLLMRLRPADLDDLGLAACLTQLAQNWTACNRYKTIYQLTIDGDCAHLPEPLPITIFRIVQECLTNIAKHASATKACVWLNISDTHISLQIADNGVAHKLPLPSTGLGLQGIKERLSAIGGQLNLAIADTGGLVLNIRLPIQC